MTDSTDLILSLPPGPREARPDDKLRKRLEGWMQHTDSRPSFETRRRRRSFRMRSEITSQPLRMTDRVSFPRLPLAQKHVIRRVGCAAGSAGHLARAVELSTLRVDPLHRRCT